MAPFRNHKGPKATVKENLGKILHFLTPVKIEGGWAKYLSEFYEFRLRSNLWYTFDRLGGESVLGVKK